MITYTWDANGNLLDDGVKTYGFDHANRLVSVADGQTTVVYNYNGLGDRVSQSVGGVTTQYTLDLNTGLTQVLAGDDGSRYVYGLGRLAQDGESGVEYFLADALGSVRQITDSSGDVTLAQTYQPFGEILSQEGTGESPYAYAGEWQDSSSELIYLRARWYAPYLNQFIQPDPIVPNPYQPWEWNRYPYARNNPIKFTDPSGLAATEVPCDQIWLDHMRALCKIANEDPDINPNALEARNDFFWNIVIGSRTYGVLGAFGVNEGYYWAGVMLEHFLRKDHNVTVKLPNGTTFQSDQGIRRAIIEKIPTIPGMDEPIEIEPSLYLLLEQLSSMDKCEKYIQIPSIKISWDKTFSSLTTSPRPYNMGWWGAFGHVKINADYKDIGVMKMPGGGYVVRAFVTYSVDDKYEWFPGLKGTPLPLGYPKEEGDPPYMTVYIPHEWEGSLDRAGLADEYDFTIRWSQLLQIMVLDDNFQQFWIYGETELIHR